MKNKGFTLIELMIVVAMLGITFVPIMRAVHHGNSYEEPEIKTIPQKDACKFCVEEINGR